MQPNLMAMKNALDGVLVIVPVELAVACRDSMATHVTAVSSQLLLGGEAYYIRSMLVQRHVQTSAQAMECAHC
jgi:hypothetical protein